MNRLKLEKLKLLWYLSSFFLIIDLYLLIPATTQISIVATELALPTEIPTNEAKSEIETYPVTAEDKISKCSV